MTVRNWRTSLKEKIVYTTPDGEKFNLHDPGLQSILTMTGWGIPPIGKASTRGPFQHGSTPLTLRVPPRTITMTIHNKSCNRDDYWAARSSLVNALRYNRGGLESPTPGNLTWYRSDGQVRQLDVILSGGPNFDPIRSGWAEFSFEDVLTFEADNPIIYTPTQISTSFSGLQCTLDENLTFPATFGGTKIVFNLNICEVDNIVNVGYVGTWMEFPKIIVSGPVEDFSIVHNELGWTLALENYAISVGESVTFDLTYGKKTISNNYGDSLLRYLSTGSEIGLFSIQPDPIVANGVNTFTIHTAYGTGDTSVLFQYYNRFIAI